MTHALDDLADQLDLILAHLTLRTNPSDALVATAEALTLRIANRRPVTPPLAVLQERLGLTPSESIVLLVLVGFEVHPALRGWLLEDGATTAGVRTEQVRRIVYGGRPSSRAISELAVDGQLARLGLLVLSRDPMGSSICSTSQRVIAFLHGATAPQGTIERVLCARPTTALEMAGLDETARAPLTSVFATKPYVLVVVSGPVGVGRRTAIVQVARAAGANTIAIDARRLSADRVVLEAECRALAFEARASACVPVICDVHVLADDQRRVLEIVFAPLIDGPLVVTCGPAHAALAWGRPSVRVELKGPTTAQLAELWHAGLGAGTKADGQRLAEQYPLAPALIHHATLAAKARAGERPLDRDDVLAGIRSVLDDRLGQYARRLDVTQAWDDIVLPEDQLATIQDLIARVRRRTMVFEQWGFAAKVGKGLGVAALFSGPPGTGKTMVASLIAKELGLELYQVDMAKIVSKFIGETEKSLAALFDAAEAGHAVLLFDEADSLFGKRTDVKSSNDRYANLETNYLLQRLESFSGVCLLTSNHERNIDPAVHRRLSLHLRFDLPDETERVKLWQATLPSAAPLATDVHFASLARRYEMSGGHIRNAALRAAFLAADEGSDIARRHLEYAARVEYEAMGKIVA